MRHHCIKWALAGGVLGWALQAHGQDIDQAYALTDPNAAMLVAILENGGLPVVLAWVAWTLSRSLTGWVPTIRVIHENHQGIVSNADDH